jgi:hypothetical protein
MMDQQQESFDALAQKGKHPPLRKNRIAHREDPQQFDSHGVTFVGH